MGKILLYALFIYSFAHAHLPLMSFQELKSAYADEELLKSIRSTLSKEGILAITGVPSLQSARRTALSSIGDCLSHTISTLRPSINSKILPDGTERRTIASQLLGSLGGGRDRLSETVRESCPNLEDSVESLRNVIDRSAVTVAAALDDAFLPISTLKVETAGFNAFFADHNYFVSAKEDIPTKSGRSWSTFSDLVSGGDQLEHFHSYIPLKENEVDKNILPVVKEFHTDAGLFLLFVPALYSNDIFDRSSLKPREFSYLDSVGKEHFIVVEELNKQEDVFTADISAVEKSAVSELVADSVITVAPDTLILMMGQGAEQWLNPSLASRRSSSNSGSNSLRAVPHSLNMKPVDAVSISSRNWYGRMFLPPAQAWLQEQNSTFAELRAAIVTAAKAAAVYTSSIKDKQRVQDIALPAGCGVGWTTAAAAATASLSTKASSSIAMTSSVIPGSLPYYSRSSSADDGDCSTDEMYCWMKCYPVSSVTCESYEEVTCVDADGNPANPGEMNSANHLGCVGVAYSDPGGFCQGVGVTMYMQGFVSYVTGDYRTKGGNTTPQCLALWFDDWVLNTESRFAAACFGCILLGILTESISYLRRIARANVKSAAFIVQLLVMCTLYASQLTLGYFAMLVAMTYQVELFVCIVSGLAIGHGIFSMGVMNYFIDYCNNIIHNKSNGNNSISGSNNKPYGSVPNGSNSSNNTTKISAFSSSLGATAPTEEFADPCCAYLHLEDEESSAAEAEAVVSVTKSALMYHQR